MSSKKDSKKSSVAKPVTVVEPEIKEVEETKEEAMQTIDFSDLTSEELTDFLYQVDLELLEEVVHDRKSEKGREIMEEIEALERQIEELQTQLEEKEKLYEERTGISLGGRKSATYTSKAEAENRKRIKEKLFSMWQEDEKIPVEKLVEEGEGEISVQYAKTLLTRWNKRQNEEEKAA